MAIKKVDALWLDGKLVPWDEATVHVMTHTLHYGLGVFEGIRAYEQPDGRPGVFRLHEHIDRLFQGAHICTLDIPYSQEDIAAACLKVLDHNKLKSAYLRPLVFLGAGAMGLGTLENPVHTLVAGFEWGAYLGDEGLKNGIRAKTSTFRRSSVDSLMTKGKVVGHYVTSILAKREALKQGYAEAILLDRTGLVAEGSGENMFLVKHGVVRTPPTEASILAGITRASVIELMREQGVTVHERSFTRDEMWTADEMFMTGTAAEVTPIREVDDRRIGSGEPGPITQALQKVFFEAVKGTDKRYARWITTGQQTI